MCGIAGMFSFRAGSSVQNVSVVERLNESQRRRGPDGSGLWVGSDSVVALGHRRLAIIDTGASGAQPMTDVTGRWTITFNGEIYNYKELRIELEREGALFHTNSDTEVIINAISMWGEKALPKLRGMFSFGLWDSQDQELWLVRDSYGIKPLYVAEAGGVVWFASQARSLASHAPVNTSRDPAGLIGYYIWGNVPEPFTWWAGITMLQAGHVLRVRKDKMLPGSRPFVNFSDSYLRAPAVPASVDMVKHAVRESVRYHLISDVPVGMFLSSGIDSSVIAAIAAEYGKSLKTITLAFDEYSGLDVDEAPLAEETARILKTDHTTVRISRDEFIALYDDFLSSMDQPSIDGLNTFFVSHAAKMAGLKVVLSGLGGDELFGGYPSFRQIPLLLNCRKLFPINKKMETILESSIKRMLPIQFSPKLSYLLSHSNDLCGAYKLRRSLYLDDDFEFLLDQSWVIAGLERLQTANALHEIIGNMNATESSSHAQISALESAWYMRNQLLRDTDWASMAHGLEVRVPLVDRSLLDALGPAIASKKPPSKKDLAACASSLPPKITSRRKTGFATPVREWAASAAGIPGRGLRGWAAEVHQHFKSN